MNRTFVAALVAGIAALPAAADRVVDIGDTRALEALRAESPGLYKKLRGILEAASKVECETLPQMLQVQYGARDVQCAGYQILTSLPAKRRLAFKLDDVSFSGNVVLTGKPPRLIKSEPYPRNPPTPMTPLPPLTPR